MIKRLLLHDKKAATARRKDCFQRKAGGRRQREREGRSLDKTGVDCQEVIPYSCLLQPKGKWEVGHIFHKVGQIVYSLFFI